MRIDARHVRGMVYAVALGNLLVLAAVFIVPRLAFMLEHKSSAHAERLATEGPNDMPNQFAGVYRQYVKIREWVPEDAHVFVPPKETAAGSVRAPVMQVLYPRRVHFGDDVDFRSQLERAAARAETFYFVYAAGWHSALCAEDALFRDARSGWGVCGFRGGSVVRQ